MMKKNKTLLSALILVGLTQSSYFGIAGANQILNNEECTYQSISTLKGEENNSFNIEKSVTTSDETLKVNGEHIYQGSLELTNPNKGILIKDGQIGTITIEKENNNSNLMIKGNSHGIELYGENTSLTINAEKVVFDGNTNSAIYFADSDKNKLLTINGDLYFQNVTGGLVKDNNGNNNVNHTIHVNGKIVADNINVSTGYEAEDILELMGVNIEADGLEVKNSATNKNAWVGSAVLLTNGHITINNGGDIKLINILNTKGNGAFPGYSGLYQDTSFITANNIIIDKLKNTSKQGLYGIWNADDSKMTVNNIQISDILNQGEGESIGLNTATTGITTVKNRVDINNVVAENGNAIGAMIFGSLSAENINVSGIKGTNSSAGIVVNGSPKFAVNNIYINNIESKNYIGGFDITEAKTNNVNNVYINTNIQNNEKYDGDFAKEPLVDAVKINNVAVRANQNGVIDWSNKKGNYTIYGDVVAGKGFNDKNTDNGNNESSGTGQIMPPIITTAENINNAGKITIGALGATTRVFGDVFAGNGGEITLNLDGKNSILYGQVDDYHDVKQGTEKTYHNSQLVDTEGNALKVQSNGQVDINLQNGASWIAVGKNIVSNVNFGTDNSVIDLSNQAGNSISIDKLDGNGTFVMNLNSIDHAKSDMLYIGTNNGTHNINIAGGITGGIDNISKDNPLRFATVLHDNGGVGHAVDSEVKAYTRDSGVWNLEYNVEKENFDKNNIENESYNGKDDGKGTNKPGNDFVENTLVGNNTSAQNWVITGVKSPTDNNGNNNNNNSGTHISDAGKTILAMSKVNYANAVYMDRLNKRMGEANYIDGDDGLWLRIRHDRIGKENAFRSKNTMFEVGYDNKVNNKENHRQGIVFDYMRGSADYSNVIGSGNIHRAGVWLYDTQYDEQGAYTDFVIKAGKLTNDFDLLAKTTGENIHGEYDNIVYALSAEYGKKIAWKNDWYIEPQAQLQYAHVTGAEYTTSQGTQVKLDGIDSLIARAGLKIGKDINQKDNIYFKADVLHEFLGDQDISAGDKTGRLYQKYDNKGTWYDLGFGFTHRFDEKTYMYADVEQSFGNDNEDTYQFNLGLNVKF